MSELFADQKPDGWNATSGGYDENIWDLMQPFVRDLVERLEVERESHVLDVAAGSGAVTMTLAPRVRRITAVDFASGMLERLRRRVQAGGFDNVEAKVMDGQALELEGGTFDAACSNFGVIFFPDRVKGFSEMRRVLRPGGRVAATAWCPPDRFELFGAFAQAIQQALPDLPKPPKPPPVFSLCEPARMEDALRQAGFERIRVDVVAHDYEVDDAEGLWTQLRTSAPPAVALLERVGPEGTEKVHTSLMEVLRERFGDGPLRFRNEALIGHAVRPQA